MFAHLYSLTPGDIDALQLWEFDIFAEDIPRIVNLRQEGAPTNG